MKQATGGFRFPTQFNANNATSCNHSVFIYAKWDRFFNYVGSEDSTRSVVRWRKCIRIQMQWPDMTCHHQMQLVTTLLLVAIETDWSKCHQSCHVQFEGQTWPSYNMRSMIASNNTIVVSCSTARDQWLVVDNPPGNDSSSILSMLHWTLHPKRSNSNGQTLTQITGCTFPLLTNGAEQMTWTLHIYINTHTTINRWLYWSSMIQSCFFSFFLSFFI